MRTTLLCFREIWGSWVVGTLLKGLTNPTRTSSRPRFPQGRGNALETQAKSLESPQMWVWPQLPFGAFPHPLSAIG